MEGIEKRNLPEPTCDSYAEKLFFSCCFLISFWSNAERQILSKFSETFSFHVTGIKTNYAKRSEKCLNAFQLTSISNQTTLLNDCE